ncbi:hypothetical protein [Psychrobacillus sp.]|uniref:hypothetical protein n=1 Tax=Psychrobacillus sp. TaxID=1871623 RepID=UPI0028BF2AEB|nr:hypothetical protein [Psychrobacillus sp.]
MDFDKIKEAVNSIEMSKTMENRLKENSNIIEKKKPGQLNYKRLISVACAFGILLSIMIGIPLFNKNGNFQGANFTITAYAWSDDGNRSNTKLLSDKATFELSTELRGITTDITGDSGHAIYTKVMLNVSGEHIDSITYTINKGKFLEDVILTAKEYADKDWLLSEKIFITMSHPDLDIYNGIKEIGNTYTVKYNEQDKYKNLITIPHDGNLAIDDDIIIKVIVKYTDGKTEQQDIVVTQESNSIESKSISLKLK